MSSKSHNNGDICVLNIVRFTHIGTGADKVKLKSPSRTTVTNN
jgi:hypothetical protein